MNPHNCLHKLLQHYQNNKMLNALLIQLNELSDDTDKLIELYNHAIPLIEQNIWQDSAIEEKASEYQQLFHELESLIKTNSSTDFRHKFIIAIPVADRPQHLNACLESILNLCQHYNYGGFHNETYTKIHVLISDDSQQTKNINENKKMAIDYTSKGLTVEYFGQHQQKKILANLDKERLINIIGNHDNNHFHHKGASITRNITYLKLQQLHKKNEPTLFYFIDSDQEFQINIQTPETDKNIYAINYFYYLDKLFSNRNISLLTGKVVGDPPVSPAVMASTFLDDLIIFVQRMAKLEPEKYCEFHNPINNISKDAAYHDMADLFGFKGKPEAYEYHCTLDKPHNHSHCFNDFANKLNQFFYGVHTTRKSTYIHQNAFKSISPARTIYTGNYIFKPKNLKYFIPFASLKLRMAGPTLGRIIQAELGDEFVSANLPMLHKRTVDTGKIAEFRPGVAQQDALIDLHGEFKRQFFGDVMLFSMIQLTEKGFPKETLSFAYIENIVRETIVSFQKKYALNQNEIVLKNSQLKTLINNPENWWNKKPTSSFAKLEFVYFINNITFNFGKNAKNYKTIHSKESTASYQQKITRSIMEYRNDVKHWENTLSSNSSL